MINKGSECNQEANQEREKTDLGILYTGEADRVVLKILDMNRPYKRYKFEIEYSKEEEITIEDVLADTKYYIVLLAYRNGSCRDRHDVIWSAGKGNKITLRQLCGTYLVKPAITIYDTEKKPLDRIETITIKPVERGRFKKTYLLQTHPFQSEVSGFIERDVFIFHDEYGLMGPVDRDYMWDPELPEYSKTGASSIVQDCADALGIKDRYYMFAQRAGEVKIEKEKIPNIKDEIEKYAIKNMHRVGAKKIEKIAENAVYLPEASYFDLWRQCWWSIEGACVKWRTRSKVWIVHRTVRDVIVQFFFDLERRGEIETQL